MPVNGGRPAGMSDEDDSDDLFFDDNPLPNASVPVEAAPAIASAPPVQNVSSTRDMKRSRVGSRFRPPPHHRGSTADLEELKMACTQGNLGVVKGLIKKGISVNVLLRSQWTPLMYACSSGHPQVVKYLLEEGADPNLSKDLFTPLMAVCGSSLTDEDPLLQCLNLLIVYGASINAMDRYKMTAVMFAAKDGKLKLVSRMIEAKADLNRQNNRGWTAMIWAAHRGFGQVIRQLMEAGADPLKMNSSGETAADVAMDQGYNTIAELLDKATKAADGTNFLTSIPVREVSSKPHNSQAVSVYGDLEMVLSGLELGNLIPLFQKHEVQFETFLRFTEEDLERIGIDKVGVRKKILDAIREIHKKDWEKTSLPQLQHSTHISCPDAVALVANLSKHVRYMHASLGYLRDQIQSQPRILELGQDSQGIRALVGRTGDTIKNTRALLEELRFFKTHLEKVQDNVSYIPADLIVQKRRPRRRWRRLLSAGVAGVILGVVLWKRPEWVATSPKSSLKVTVV